MKLRLHLGREQALIIQEYQTLGKVISQALGGSKSSKTAEEVTIPKTGAEMQAAFKSVFG